LRFILEFLDFFSSLGLKMVDKYGILVVQAIKEYREIPC
jgi:hypothetical protein